MNNLKICLVTSRGGHLFQLIQLQSWWKKYDRFWITFHGSDTDSLLKNERIYYAYYPENRNVINAIKNSFLALRILRKERPSLLISCGAGICPPFFYVGKLLGMKLIYIEPYDFVAYPTLSGKLVEPIVDELLVQHKKQLKFYKHAKFKGSLL